MLMTALGVYLAYLAIKMGRENDIMTTRQLEILKGQRALLEELGELERSQTEAAVRHEALASEAAEARAEIGLVVDDAEVDEQSEGGTRLSVFLEAKDHANDLPIVQWTLSLPARLEDRVSVEELATGLDLDSSRWLVWLPQREPFGETSP